MPSGTASGPTSLRPRSETTAVVFLEHQQATFWTARILAGGPPGVSGTKESCTRNIESTLYCASVDGWFGQLYLTRLSTLDAVRTSWALYSHLSVCNRTRSPRCPEGRGVPGDSCWGCRYDGMTFSYLRHTCAEQAGIECTPGSSWGGACVSAIHHPCSHS
jgi:hypothetical protein